MSEAWPTWVFCTQLLHLTCRQVYISTLRGGWLQILREAYPAITFTGFTTAAGLPVAAPVLVQGSRPWLRLHRGVFESLSDVMIVSLAEDGQPPGQELFGSMASELVWHKDVGGFSILHGGWRFWFNQPLSACRQTTSAVIRWIRHVVESTQWPSQGVLGAKKCCAAPLGREEQYFDKVEYVDGDHVVDWNGLLPLEFKGIQVRCQSVFSPTGWVQRPLSGLEIGRAWDEPTRLLHRCAGSETEWLFI